MSKPNGPQPTPISILIQLLSNPNQPPLEIQGLDIVDIKTQIDLLNADKCNSAAYRNEVVNKLNIEDLRKNAHKRIRLKSLLCAYHKQWLQIKHTHFKMLENWNDFDFSLHIVVYFIQHSDDGKSANENEEKELKRLNTTWRFLDYLIQYFQKTDFDGKQFVQNHINDPNQNDAQKKNAGFGLTIVKEVCKQFDQKTGQYTKVKKQLSAWAKDNTDRYEKESNFSLDDLKENDGNVANAAANNNNDNAINHNNPIDNNQANAMQNDHAAAVQQGGGGGGGGSKQPSGGLKNGEKWYWFCDEGGIKWVPYKDQHQTVIEEAWLQNKPHVIIMGKFKIDFHRDNDQVAAGQQYNYQIHNAWRRGVIRGKPDPKTNLLNDIPVDNKPK